MESPLIPFIGRAIEETQRTEKQSLSMRALLSSKPELNEKHSLKLVEIRTKSRLTLHGLELNEHCKVAQLKYS